ncbi:MAG: prepilin-type N-terminal cleavage/methylation domain-containing protein [Deltaproteobacteria bacterium]|nr:prepilin-type N-terminal cleavage/methylation domain-containing protein [Deltaproteobacteria bacterium]
MSKTSRPGLNFFSVLLKKGANNQGFSLLEILVALGILAITLVALYTSQGSSLKASAAASRIQVATLLARNQLNFKLIELEKAQAKNNFPKDKEEDDGIFESPYEDYRWHWTIEKAEIPIGIAEGGASSEGEAQQPGMLPANSSYMGQIAQLVTEQLKESLRSIKLEVSWEELGSTHSVVLTTHIVKL